MPILYDGYGESEYRRERRMLRAQRRGLALTVAVCWAAAVLAVWFCLSSHP